MTDNQTITRRQEKLIPSLVGKKWKQLLEEASNGADIDYVQLNTTLEKIREARNEFMHQGEHWSIGQELKEECVDCIWPMMNLFVSMNNLLIHPIYLPARES